MTEPKIRASEVTDEALFLNRREVLRLGAVAAIGATLAGCPGADEADAARRGLGGDADLDSP